MKPELLAPAGNLEMLRTALQSGADSVYFGIQGLNMRSTSRNFTAKDLKAIVEEVTKYNAKAYLAMNVIAYESELEVIESSLKEAKKAGIHGIICWDHSVIRLAKKIGLNIHISTQASVSNSESANFYHDLGAKVVVLAREVTLDEAKSIKSKTPLKIEVFVHGAMCVSISGRCFMSEHLYGKSANRGECIQPCRRQYIVTDKETGKELELDNNFVMSPKDLCTLPFLEKIYPVADILKIEGRGRSPEYVKYVVSAYREAIDCIERGVYDDKKKEELVEKVSKVYNRGFSDGFFMGRPVSEFTDSYGSKSTMIKEYLGVVVNYFPKAGAAEIKVEANQLRVGDDLLVIGSTTGTLEFNVKSIQVKKKDVELAKKGENVAINCDERVRKNDKVFVWKKKN